MHRSLSSLLFKYFRRSFAFYAYLFSAFGYKGTDVIEGIFLDLSKIKDVHLGPGASATMSNLRLLKFYTPKLFCVAVMVSKVHLPQGLKYLPDELRYLYWHRYPLKMLLNFSLETLLDWTCLILKLNNFGKEKGYNSFVRSIYI